MPRRSLYWDYLGRVPYTEAVELQLAARSALKTGEGPERLLLLEHPHVYTLGRNASEADVLAGPEWLRARGVEVAECDRGGQVTYHGPGQLVGYPIVNLSPDRRDSEDRPAVAGGGPPCVPKTRPWPARQAHGGP